MRAARRTRQTGNRERRAKSGAGTDLRLLQPVPGAAVSRAVEPFAEQRVSRRIRPVGRAIPQIH